MEIKNDRTIKNNKAESFLILLGFFGVLVVIVTLYQLYNNAVHPKFKIKDNTPILIDIYPSINFETSGDITESRFGENLRQLDVTFITNKSSEINASQAQGILRSYLDAAMKKYPDKDIQVFAWTRKNKNDGKENDVMAKFFPDEGFLMYKKENRAVSLDIPSWVAEKKAFDALPKEEQAQVLKKKADEERAKKVQEQLEKKDRDAKALEKLKAGAQVRLFYKTELRDRFLNQGLNIKVSVSGKYYENLTLEYALFDEVWFYKLNKDNFDSMHTDLGFQKITVTNGFDYSRSAYWK